METRTSENSLDKIDIYALPDRKLEIRAWDSDGSFFQPTKTPKMTYGNDVLRFLPSLIADPCITLMQFIGLRDKNAIKIYEGDIIRFSYHLLEKERFGIVKYAEKWAQFYISTKNVHGVGIALSNTYQWYFDDNGETECEVVGNIFEHPEILKGV